MPPTALYRLFDDKGVLLYVGIADNPEQRLGSHASMKPWWCEVEIRGALDDIPDEALLAELGRRLKR